MLILDEGRSALDGENERKVLDAVALERKPTVLVVTPELEAMGPCDRIVVVGTWEGE